MIVQKDHPNTKNQKSEQVFVRDGFKERFWNNRFHALKICFLMVAWNSHTIILIYEKFILMAISSVNDLIFKAGWKSHDVILIFGW
jgi:hypothetical protein